jgi:hypothetical protein
MPSNLSLDESERLRAGVRETFTEADIAALRPTSMRL